MATVTRLKLGPADHDRPLTDDEFTSADYAPGFKYEIIDGRLYVSPLPNLPEDVVESWLYGKLYPYSRAQPDVINYVTRKGRVFVPGRPGTTVPEPDLTAFQHFPFDRPLADIHWQDLCPLLVVEVLSSDPQKDLVRNVELYLAVPSIKEYWVVDMRADAERPTFLAHRRHGKQWRVKRLAYGDTYTTRLLPGFSLLIDPRR